MPRIFDNIEEDLLPALRETIAVSDRADFCVGYFNLRGWKALDSYIERWSGGEGHCCRLLVGMQRLPAEELRTALSLARRDTEIDNQTALRLKKRLAEEFRDQLAVGTPTNEDEACLRRLASQIKAKKVVVKLFLRHPLHAKLYLLFRPDRINPIVGYLGSSNLTLAGLSGQGELNVDVLDHDACQKLARWFEDRWEDRWCIDVSSELVQIIEESWARDALIPPYHNYVKIAYHLSQEARAGLNEFRIPVEFRRKLFEFQTAAVKIAAHHLNKRGGVLIGDVVGLGKTLMATALARTFEDDFGLETLILCPKNLVSMWEDYRDQYRLHGRVLPISVVIRELPKLRRFRLIVIDESQNLRNREGKRYRAIQEYIQENDSKCILLSATPYNKTYLDLANQLRLFVPEDRDLGIRPERLLRELGETEFIRRHQSPVRSLPAFEHSPHADDWRELMRLYLVRRTRTFIQENYAETDPENGRKYLTFEDGTRSYFPNRIPKTVKFTINDKNPADQYARLYADRVVGAINGLNLPRYGLGNYIAPAPHEPPSQTESKVLQDLSRAGKRLMGFCRTNLFKRLESSGQAFIQSVERHVVRNYIYLHAIEKGLPIPIGTQDAEFLDTRFTDNDELMLFDSDDENGDADSVAASAAALLTETDFRRRSAEVYDVYAGPLKHRFKWLRPGLFVNELTKDLRKDIEALLGVLKECGDWDPDEDTKLDALWKLVTETHANEKVIVFTQFADTVHYLEAQLRARALPKVAGVTGDSSDPTALAWRLSPESNQKRGQVTSEQELRVLISTDVLSEGQNLQDCAIVVSYDLPWAIIRLVQRAGRVDRIGQKAENILCYSFLPADGVERIIRLRARVRQRLRENAEVVGTDEAFFEDDRNDQTILDLYHEKAGILEGEAETEVDLASYAYQIWKNAITTDPSLEKTVPELPPVVFATKAHQPREKEPYGVLVYMRTAECNDALAWMDKNGSSVTESQFAILKAAECAPDTPALPRQDEHHALVQKAVELIVTEEKSVGGQLGRPSGARFRAYERLMRYAAQTKGTLFESQELLRAIDDIYRYPLRPTAVDTLNRQLRSGISDEDLAQLVIALRDEDRLCLIHEEEQTQEPRIICSMGLSSAGGGK
ncbi:MAG: phospholipase D-like domain-containing protein [Acidobacteria bacterium]|nr:phospholipase D-like domain-containing protein [Acidobacteriota bacterium]